MPALDHAWIDDGERRFMATCPRPRPLADSAITRLIHGIWEYEPAMARKILRRRIHATEANPGEMDWGMVKVAAKRLEAGASLEAAPPAPGQRVVEVGDGPALPLLLEGLVGPQRKDHASYMSLARVLASRIEVAEERFRSDRRIAALLVSREGELLAGALNSSSRNRTRHAEVNLVQGYCRVSGQPLPAGARVYTTLQSCKMCAGMIWDAARDPGDLEIYYGEPDPGPMARFTVFTPGSFERKRACVHARAGLRDRQIEFPLPS